jgi:hypothetical protein
MFIFDLKIGFTRDAPDTEFARYPVYLKAGYRKTNRISGNADIRLKVR